jgi:hypothetical protein
MKEQMYSGLEFACQRSNNVLVSSFLKNGTTENSYVDVLRDNGLYFKIVIAHDNGNLFQILLDYMYDTNQIEKDPKDNNTNQSIKYNKLQQVLKEAKNEFSTSKEILSLIDDICHEDTDYNSDSDSLYDQDITNLCSSFNNLENNFTFGQKLSDGNLLESKGTTAYNNYEEVKLIFDEYITEHKHEIKTSGDVIHTEIY